MNKQKWLLDRKKGIGGSESAILLGLNEYKSPLDVYLDKVDPNIKEDAPTLPMQAGTILEPLVAELYSKETGYKLKNPNRIYKHKKYKFLIGTPDRIIIDKEKGNGILEIKTTNGFYKRTWESEIPPSYYCQLQHYLAVTGLKWGSIAVLVDNRDFFYYNYERDEEFIKVLINKVSDFWNNFILKEIKPEPINKNDLLNLYPNIQAKSFETDVNIKAKIKTILSYKEDIKNIKKKVEELEFEIQKEFEENETMNFEGEVLATFKESKISRFNKDLLLEAHPELRNELNDYYKTTISRTLKIKGE